MNRKVFSGMMLTLLLGSMLFSAIVLVESETETHDLEVFLKAPIIRNTYNHLTNGTSTVLNVTVVNKGNVAEQNVNLQLLINESIALNATAFNLSPNGTFWIAYLWAPEDGVYNFTAYAPPVIGESPPYDANNIVTKWVNVSTDEAPHVNFIYSPLSPPPDPHPVKNELITFNASYPISYDPDWGTILTYKWDFGDDNVTIIGDDEPITPIITHKYTSGKFYNVTLTLVDTENLPSYKTKSIKVCSPPIAYFAPPSGYRYVDYPLAFDASASRDPDNDTGPTRGLANYTWDFDDGNITTTSALTITHTYTTNRTYTVNLTVTDYDNLNHSYYRDVTIGLGIPTADFEITHPYPLPGPYYVNETLSFDASNSLPNGKPIVNYTWTFSDGRNDTGKIVHHTFGEAKVYNVTLTVTDEKGLTDSISKNVTVLQRVYVKVEEYGDTTIVHNPEEPSFDVNITISNVEDLFDFEFKLSWPPTWLPPEGRLLDYISVREGDFLGDYLDQKGRMRYNFRPYPDEGEGYILINCTFKSYVPKEERSGNGTLVTIEFQVLSPGNCTLSLSTTELINSTGGEIDPKMVDGMFYTKTPVAKFNYYPAYPPVDEPVTFDASFSYDPGNSTSPTHGIANYTWDFGDGNITTVNDSVITHAYKNESTYKVTLTVANYANETWPTWRNITVGLVHDVAVVDVTPSATKAYVGWIVNITVVIENEGNATEDFNVTAYYNNSSIGTLPVTDLESGANTTLTFMWNTTGITPCQNYTIKAIADTVQYENDAADNTRTYGTVKINLMGDVNDDSVVDGSDVVIVIEHVPSYPGPGSPKPWDPNCDLNNDNVVDGSDVVIVIGKVGSHC